MVERVGRLAVWLVMLQLSACPVLSTASVSPPGSAWARLLLRGLAEGELGLGPAVKPRDRSRSRAEDGLVRSAASVRLHQHDADKMLSIDPS